MAPSGLGSDEVLRDYALNNMRAVLAGLRVYDLQSIQAGEAKKVSIGWRADRLEAASRWAVIAEALRGVSE